MEKCLLDILEEERRIVQHIDTLSDRIKVTSDRRKEKVWSENMSIAM